MKVNQDSYHKNNAQDSNIKLKRTMDIHNCNYIPCVTSNIMIQPDSELTHQVQSVKTLCCEQ